MSFFFSFQIDLDFRSWFCDVDIFNHFEANTGKLTKICEQRIKDKGCRRLLEKAKETKNEGKIRIFRRFNDDLYRIWVVVKCWAGKFVPRYFLLVLLLIISKFRSSNSNLEGTS